MMEDEVSRVATATKVSATEVTLEQDVEYLKNLLLEHDRSLAEKLSRGEKPSLEEKKARSRIIRQLNRIRRQLYRLKTGTELQPTRRISFRVHEEDFAHLQALAQEEGLSISAYIRKQLFPER
jgi:hypothetical protein